MYLDNNELIGKRVRNKNAVGTIVAIKDGKMEVSFHGEISRFLYPDAFATVLRLEDEELQEVLEEESADVSFQSFKTYFANAIGKEITYLKSTGGKKYRAIDGERIRAGEVWKEHEIVSFNNEKESKWFVLYLVMTVVIIYLHNSQGDVMV
ncbi:MAG: hypothetical protein E7290_08125 [Lachnospiraceae bacterium]|nr:hypothetical protein [Lachnospiraceae bacterium]